MHRSLYENSCLLLYSQSALEQLLWECISDNFEQYFEQNASELHFCQIFAPRRLSTRRFTKEAADWSFRRSLKNATLGKSY